jgi:hypothetical protein
MYMKSEILSKLKSNLHQELTRISTPILEKFCNEEIIPRLKKWNLTAVVGNNDIIFRCRATNNVFHCFEMWYYHNTENKAHLVDSFEYGKVFHKIPTRRWEEFTNDIDFMNDFINMLDSDFRTLEVVLPFLG